MKVLRKYFGGWLWKLLHLVTNLDLFFSLVCVMFVFDQTLVRGCILWWKKRSISTFGDKLFLQKILNRKHIDLFTSCFLKCFQGHIQTVPILSFLTSQINIIVRMQAHGLCNIAKRVSANTSDQETSNSYLFKPLLSHHIPQSLHTWISNNKISIIAMYWSSKHSWALVL